MFNTGDKSTVVTQCTAWLIVFMVFVNQMPWERNMGKRREEDKGANRIQKRW
jgi:hypothetical protein